VTGANDPSRPQWPPVTVVVPARNEEAYIETSLGALLDQDYEGELEFLVVDGMSDDATCQIVKRMREVDPRIRLVPNPARITPAALNLGAREASHTLITIVGAHTLAPRDFVRQCVLEQQRSNADLVGGTITVEGRTYLAQAIAVGMESMFGVGTAAWRGAAMPRDTDTVPFGLVERERVIELGGFDETLVRNQDYEFNYRLRQSGGRIRYSPKITTVYYSRQNLRTLWRQYFQYGVWKARVVQMHPKSLQLRQMVAPLFVSGLLVGGLLVPLGAIWRWIYAVALGAYLMLALFFSAQQARRRGWRYFLVIPLVFLTMHVAWGLGFLVGVWHWWIWRRKRWR
jgi:cellulose synthase/poly-beta-1,6-N-acetylglucosamine synthase-like glycosyltransferase